MVYLIIFAAPPPYLSCLAIIIMIVEHIDHMGSIPGSGCLREALLSPRPLLKQAVMPARSLATLTLPFDT